MQDQISEIMTLSRTISIRPVKSFDDYKNIIDLRTKGYRLDMLEESVDKYDFSSNSVILIAHNAKGNVVGTVRLLTGLEGPIELENFIDVSKFSQIGTRSFVETTRFVVMNTESELEKLCTKMVLSKAYYLYSFNGSYEYLLMSAKDKVAGFYKAMLFKDIGEDGVYTHSKMKDATHRTYYVHVPSVREEYESSNHPFLEFMLDPRHSIEF